MNIGVVGLGYWGPNIVRNLLSLHQRVHVYDTDAKKVLSTVRRFGDCIPVASMEDLLDDPRIRAIALAVPLPSHCDLIIRSLQAHKHVFVEKPLCFSLAEADAICRQLNGSVLMVAHITEFGKGIQKLSRIVREGRIGSLRRLSFTRTHLGPVYSDTDVLTEVAAHDVAILTSLVSESPLRLHAWGVGRIDAATVDAAHIVLQWKSGCIAQIDVQWSSVVRRRDMEIEGTTGTLVLHSGSVPEELHLYDHGKAYEELRNGGRPGSTAELIKCLNIDVESGEPLCDELSHFLECIESGRKPRTDFEFSRKVVSILEAARQSMHSGGSGVDLP